MGKRSVYMYNFSQPHEEVFPSGWVVTHACVTLQCWL